MPAKKLTPAQLSEAAHLKEMFLKHQEKLKADGLPSSQDELASQFGLGNQSAIAQYLSGKIPLNGEAVLKFSAMLGVPPTEVSKIVSDHEFDWSLKWLNADATARHVKATLLIERPAPRASLPRQLIEDIQALEPGLRTQLVDIIERQIKLMGHASGTQQPKGKRRGPGR